MSPFFLILLLAVIDGAQFLGRIHLPLALTSGRFCHSVKSRFEHIHFFAGQKNAIVGRTYQIPVNKMNKIYPPTGSCP